MGAKWTAEEDDVIRKHYPGEGGEATSTRLEGRTGSQVTDRAKRLNVRRVYPPRLSDREPIPVEIWAKALGTWT